MPFQEPSTALPAAWHSAFSECANLPPESLAWEQIDEFIIQLRLLAEIKLESRQRHRQTFGNRLDFFLGTYDHALQCGDLPQVCRDWKPDGVTSEAQAQTALEALDGLELLLTNLAEAKRGLGPDMPVESILAASRRIGTLSDSVALQVRQLSALLIPSSNSLPYEEQDFVLKSPASELSILAEPSLSLPNRAEFTISPAQAEVAGSEETALPATESPSDADEKVSDAEAIVEESSERQDSIKSPGKISPAAAAAEPATSFSRAESDPKKDAANRVVETAVRSTALAPSPIPDLPPDLVEYTDFRRNHRVNLANHCEQGAWMRPDFVQRLSAASMQNLYPEAWHRLWLYCRACVLVGGQPMFNTADLEDLACLWLQPDSPLAGSSSDRANRLVENLYADPVPLPSELLLTTLLEALRPSVRRIRTNEVEDIFNALELDNADLASVLKGLLRLSVFDPLPVQRLQALRSTMQAPSPETLSRELQQWLEQFRPRARILQNSVGGNIQRTHCRIAWKQFVNEHVTSVMNLLLPPDGGSSKGTPNEVEILRSQVSSWQYEHEKIADAVGAKYQDRKTMDRAVMELIDGALRIINLTERLQQSRHSQHVSVELGSLDEACRRLLQSPAALSLPHEELCRQVLQRLLAPAGAASDGSEASLLLLTIVDLCEHPDLLPMLSEDEAIWQGAKLRDVHPVTRLSEPVRAAAILLDPPLFTVRQPIGSADELLMQLRNELLRSGRNDLLRYLLGSTSLPGSERVRAHSEHADRMGELDGRLEEFKSLWRDTDELQLSIASTLGKIARHVEQLLHKDQPYVLSELPLFDYWLLELVDFARQCVEAERANICRMSTQLEDDELRRKIDLALSQGRYADALNVLEQRQDAFERVDDDGPGFRETLWRQEAAVRYPRPIEALEPLLSSEVNELVRHWRNRPREHNDKRRLRRLFYNFISGEKDGGSDNAAERSWRQISNSQIRVDCYRLVELMHQEGLDPTFLPQLRDFKELVIVSPTLDVTAATSFARTLSRQVGSEAGQGKNLVIFLTPLLSANLREECLREMRGRSQFGVVIDDLDLCRLLAPSGHRPRSFLGLLEIALEQIDPKDLSPFRSNDGQYVQMEMFVGRLQQARDLAFTARYSRIFSGRKLGKSALLKYVSLSLDGELFASGNRLRVLYIIVAGGDSEPWLVNRIIEAMREQLGFPCNLDPGVDPGEQLTTCMRRFTRERAGENLLIILDEADAFVEGQLKAYDEKRERCLSFRMMKDIPGETDRTGLPRVRFVFSGYRVTDRRGGAWANAGDVLRLDPLQPDEAAQLIRGPLARMGIDAYEQAPAIARRCGFQPAVLLRFGDRLLQRKQPMLGGTARKRVCVERNDVVAVFNDPLVQEEIRTIVRNNFQGNRMGDIIFSALLLAFRDRPPSRGLANAPEEILRILREIDPDTSWLKELDPVEEEEVRRELADLVNRQLLVETNEDGRHGDPVYRLRFTHHLWVLIQGGDLRNYIQQLIKALRDSATRDDLLINSILPPQAMNDLHTYTGTSPDLTMPVALAVVGSLWPEVLQNDRGGIPDRLGFGPGDVRDLERQPLGNADLQNERLIAINAPAAAIDQIFNERERTKATPLLLGGMDLLRRALEVEEEYMDRLVLCRGTRRLNAARLTWWFERLRSYNFDTPDAIVRVMARTSGIPLLVRQIDDALIALNIPPGGTVSDQQLKIVLDGQFDAGLQQRGWELAAGPAAIRLTAREQQLVRMAAGIGALGRFNFNEEMGKSWEANWQQDILIGASGYNPQVTEDRKAMELLQMSGLLPLDSTGWVDLTDQDALCMLVHVMQGINAPEKA